MRIKVRKSSLSGEILIPGSKSHTIRAISIASMAFGTSVLSNVLESADTLSCIEGVKAFGAHIEKNLDYIIKGTGGIVKESCNIDVGNSGTTLRLLTALAALSDKQIVFDGDKSIRTRQMQPLLGSLQDIGVKVESLNGKCPIKIKGPIIGGKTRINGISSQFVSALLIAAPLAANDTEIFVENLHEKPYVEITLAWLDYMGIKYLRAGLDWFKIKGGQSYKAFKRSIPADFSSATFPLCAAAVTHSDITIKGLDFNDRQGDKEVFRFLERMGANINYSSSKVTIKGNRLKGIDIDLNNTPDALPALAVTGCFAQGITRLLNVKQARFKECDRIKAIFTELKKMGADIEELDDGLVIRESKLMNSHNLHGYDDHRMVMSLAIAGMGIDGETIIDTAESINVTYPGFIKDFNNLGAKIEILD